MFQSAYGKLYLVSQELVAWMDMEWKEDRWLLSQLLDGMKSPAAPKPLTKSEQRLADVLAAPRGKLHPASVLLGGGDYSVRRRLGGHLKEAQWMGETVAVKHFVGDAKAKGGQTARAQFRLYEAPPLLARTRPRWWTGRRCGGWRRVYSPAVAAAKAGTHGATDQTDPTQ